MNTPKIYYNEHNPYAARWLRNLMALGVIAHGVVDERSIEDVTPSELMGFTQCHFFAGIGVWAYALRRAGWPDDRPVWTGSCPCQPFSAAGEGKGFADERHLWPAWFHLIVHGKGRDVPVFGEQVASADGLEWLDVVCADMENANNACWPVDLCAAGFGGPNIRQRLYFLAHALSAGRPEGGAIAGNRPLAFSGSDSILANAQRIERGEVGVCGLRQADGPQGSGPTAEFAGGRDDGGMGNTESRRPDERGHRHEGGAEHAPQGGGQLQGGGGADITDAGIPDGLDHTIGHGRGARRDGHGKNDGVQPDATGEHAPAGYGGLDNAASARLEGAEQNPERKTRDDSRLRVPSAGIGHGGMANADHEGRQHGATVAGGDATRNGTRKQGNESSSDGQPHGMADTDGARGAAGIPEPQQWEKGFAGESDDRGGERGGPTPTSGAERTGPLNGFWRNADWLRCRDGKWRPVESGTFPLVDGSAFDLGSGGPFEGKSRAKILEGYGNALNAVCAEQFIRCAMMYLDHYAEGA